MLSHLFILFISPSFGLWSTTVFEKFLLGCSCEVVFDVYLDLGIFKACLHIALQCIFEHKKTNLALVSHCLSLFIITLVADPNPDSDLLWHLKCVSAERFAVLCSWGKELTVSVAREKRKTTETQIRSSYKPQKSFIQLLLKGVLPIEQNQQCVLWYILWLYGSLAHDVCHLCAQVYQDWCIRSCHDREQSGHHWVWNSSLPRPLQKHLLQVRPIPDLLDIIEMPSSGLICWMLSALCCVSLII